MEHILTPALGLVIRVLEVSGVLVIIIGAIIAAMQFLHNVSAPGAYKQLRSTLGRAILLGLELLVAADIINTVAIEPTLDRVALLAGVVLIRTFLSLSLEVEIEGRWPWQQRRDSASPPAPPNPPAPASS